MRLDRCRAKREHRGRGALRVPLEIDEDVDAVVADRLRESQRRPPGGIDETVEAAHEPFAHRAAIVGSRRIRDDLEPRPVVRLEQTGREVGGRVRVQVGGQVADAQAVGVQFRRRRRSAGGASTAVHALAQRNCSCRDDGCDSNTKGDNSGVPAAMPS